MANLLLILTEDRVGLTTMRSAGLKPGYTAPQWRTVEDMEALLKEPVLLAAMVREMAGNDKKHDVYVVLWPGGYRSIMFSYSKKRSSDVKRLRLSELETVFHGETERLYAYDLLLDRGRASFGEKARRLIYVMSKVRIEMMLQTFAAQKLTVKRIAPMDTAAAEAALHFWNPAKNSVSACLMMDENCTAAFFFKNGALQNIRTLPDGFGGVVKYYSNVTGLSREECREKIHAGDLLEREDKAVLTVLQDEVLRAVNALAVETVKSLHAAFGNDAVLENVMLCGGFSTIPELKEQLDTMLQADCLVAGKDTLKPGTVDAVCADETVFRDMFPFAAASAAGADLMQQHSKEKSDKAGSYAVTALLALAAIGLVAANPIMNKDMANKKADLEAQLAQPEYVAVEQLTDEKLALGREKANLLTAIENLPHGESNSAGILTDIIALTGDYGTVTSATVDYNGKRMELSFSTVNYDSFVLWQKKITDEGRFSFLEPPSFQGSGMSYQVSAMLTAVDFEESETAEVEEETSEEQDLADLAGVGDYVGE